MSRNTATYYTSINNASNQIAQELGAQYLVEGSVRSIGDVANLSVKLTETESGRVLWGVRKNVAMQDLYGQQEEITRNIISAIEPEINRVELASLRARRPVDLEAWELYRQGHALMSINAVKGVEIGAGFASVEQKGTEHRDELTPEGFRSNHAGGILGGISSGQDIVASIAMKPTSSIRLPGDTIDTHGDAVEVVTTGRHDPCVGIRATPIAEAMLALVLMDHVMRHRAQNIDVHSETPVIPGGQ